MKRLAALVCAAASLAPSIAASPGDAAPGAEPLARRYREGEVLVYAMKGSNADVEGTVFYEAKCTGTVERDAAGRFVESFAWSDFARNGVAVPLSDEARRFRDILSRSPGVLPTMPDLRRAPRLTAPVTDLLTFYADLFVASMVGATRAGDHRFLPSPQANSWAAGEGMPVAEDSIDFDVALAEVNESERVATLRVKHLPPREIRVKLPAAWMQAPVGDAANNWVQVIKRADGGFTAEVGRESFDVAIRLDLADGKILSATMDNPVDVVRRQCADAALSQCGDPLRYRIQRHVELKLIEAR